MPMPTASPWSNPTIDRELDRYLHTTSELDACSDSMVAFIQQLRE